MAEATAEPPELSRTANVIPYVEYHVGPRRLLTIELTSGNNLATRHRPIVSIDGRQFVVVWGSVAFEIPADRNVHVSVHVEADYVTQSASLILAPHPASARFVYATHFMSGIGSLTPVG